MTPHLPSELVNNTATDNVVIESLNTPWDDLGALRIDELDDSIVSYWCNLRTEGKMLNRQASKIQEKIHAKGTTDKFGMELFGDMDLKGLGNHGPAKVEAKNKQVGSAVGFENKNNTSIHGYTPFASQYSGPPDRALSLTSTWRNSWRYTQRLASSRRSFVQAP